MAENAAKAKAFQHLKLKISDASPIEKLETIRRARPDATLVIDVNQGWSFAELVEYAPHCNRLNIAMIEQPLERGKDDELVSYRAPVPLGADESCLHLGEFAAVPEKYQVLNIKLDKCGGLTEGLQLVEAAKANGMQLMIGNMTGSSLSMAPAYVVGQFCQFIDIDGPLLQKDDVQHGLIYQNGGEVSIPTTALWG
jgi:L-alanine-DL-glutamate epimerase-like enolase superfamily enzyme